MPHDELLRQLAAMPPDSRVLDLGCGDGARTHDLARLGFDVHATDASPERVEAVRKRLADVLDDAERRVVHAHPDALGYPDAFFDWVAAFHLGDADLPQRGATRDVLLDTLREVRRVLKPGAWVHLTAPALPTETVLDATASHFAADAAPVLRFTIETLRALAVEADLAEGVAPKRYEVDGQAVLGAIYRCVEAGVSA